MGYRRMDLQPETVLGPETHARDKQPPKTPANIVRRPIRQQPMKRIKED